MSLRRHLHLEFVRDSKRMKHLLIKIVVVTRFASGGFGGEIVKVADDVIGGVQTAVIAKQSVDSLLKRDSFETSVTSNIHRENPIQVTIAPPDGHEKGEEDPLQVAIEEMGDLLAKKQREEDEHRQAAVLSSTLIDPVGSTPKYPEDDPEKALGEDWRRAEVIDIHFDMSRGEDGQLLHPIPEEVRATLPKDSEKRNEILKSMTGECRYYKGPSDHEMDLDRFHTSQRPMKLDELDRENPPYFLAHKDAVKLPLMHTVNDIKMAVERNNSMSPELEAQFMDYQLNTTTDLHRVDLHESLALIPEFGPHDMMRSTLHVPADTKIEYIKSITAPQESKQDNRFNPQAFQGGNHQYLVLSCDTSRCEITESVRLNKSIELDPRGPKYNQITYLDHPRDRFEAYPKNDPEKAWQGQDVARHLDRLTDKQVHAPSPTREEYSSPSPAVNSTEPESPSPSPSLSSPSKVEPELLQEPARRQQIDQGQQAQPERTQQRMEAQRRLLQQQAKQGKTKR